MWLVGTVFLQFFLFILQVSLQQLHLASILLDELKVVDPIKEVGHVACTACSI
jgi:hypothetical protein